MLRILFSPSEAKRKGGDGEFELGSLLFEDLKPLRKQLLQNYKEIISSLSTEQLKKFFALKSEEEIERYRNLDQLKSPTIKAVERYCGVAYEYLDYPSLPNEAKEYLNRHLIIFSNLFGPIRASDMIPEYRLKQGVALGSIKTEREYKMAATPYLDDCLSSDEVLDLRAGYYNKFYKVSRPHLTMKFLKNGKTLSHWAKAYRGIILRQIALNRVDTLEELLTLCVSGLKLIEIQKSKNHTQVFYEIDEHTLR